MTGHIQAGIDPDAMDGVRADASSAREASAAAGPGTSTRWAKYRLPDLIDVALFQKIQERLSEIYPFPSAIIDNDGVVHTATARQDACTKFHRTNPECLGECIKSDRYIMDHLAEANPVVSYRCPHGLVDNAIPIIVEGEHVGNFFTGQFFMEDPDLERFRAQARKYGFEESGCLEAIRKVPILSAEKLNSYLSLIKGLVEVISWIALKNYRVLEAQRKLEESGARYRSLLQTAMDGFWLLDMEGHLLEVNDTYCRMSGYCRSDLLEKSVGDLDIIKLPGETAAYVRRIIEKGEDRFESRHRCHDGSLMDVEVSVQYRPDEEGRLVAFLRDISERKRAEAETSRTEAELQHSRKIESMGRLAGGVAHDFNNKLSIILGNVGLALAAARPDDPIVERLCEIQEAAEYSAALTRQLLGFARR